jgi:hypothetical protein
MSTATITDWKTSLKALCRKLGRGGTLVLRAGLRDDDPRLCRFGTTRPIAVSANLGRPCEECDLVTYPYLVTHPGATVGDVDREFQRLSVGGHLGPLVALWDDEHIVRPRLFALLLPEVGAALAELGPEVEDLA